MTLRSSRRSKEQLIYQQCRSDNNQTYYQKHKIGQLLGKGGFASCFLMDDVVEKTQNAVKIIVKKNAMGLGRYYDNKDKVKFEISVMQKLQHRNVVRFKRSFEDEENVYVVLQLCRHGSLSEMIKKRKYICQPQARYLVVQMIEALKYIKSQGIIHRDIKLANYLLGEGYELKLADFGLSTFDFSTHKNSVCGTPNYIAPEILEHSHFSFQADLWSTGVLIFTLLLGTPPFETKSAKQTYDRIKKVQYSFKGPYSGGPLSPEAVDFIKKIFVHDPEKRIKLDDMLCHPWITNSALPIELESGFKVEHPSQYWVQKHKKSEIEDRGASPKGYRIGVNKKLRSSGIKPMGRAGTALQPIELKLEDSFTVRHRKKKSKKPERIKLDQSQKEFPSLIEVQKAFKPPRVQDLSSSTQKKKNKKKKYPQPYDPRQTFQTSNFSIKSVQKLTKKKYSFKVKIQESSQDRNTRLAGKIMTLLSHKNYSRHFGVVFIFQDHSFCFAFNDYSKFKLAQDHRQGHYIFKSEEKVVIKPLDIQQLEEHGMVNAYKQKIIRSFCTALEREYPPKFGPIQQPTAVPIYINCYYSTDAALVCRLSNGVIQVFCKDKSMMVWAPWEELLIDTDENKTQQILSTRDLPKDDEGIKRRLTYIRQFLKQFGVNRSIYEEGTTRKTLKRRH